MSLFSVSIILCFLLKSFIVGFLVETRFSKTMPGSSSAGLS